MADYPSAMGKLSIECLAALVACTSKNDYGIPQPGGDDAAIDTPMTDASVDARPDASPNVADLDITLTGAPDPVAASATLTYTIDVTNHGGLDASNVTVSQRLPPGNVTFQS